MPLAQLLWGSLDELPLERLPLLLPLPLLALLMGRARRRTSTWLPSCALDAQLSRSVATPAAGTRTVALMSVTLSALALLELPLLLYTPAVAVAL